ncbi:MAG: hypothetical protein RLZZ511_3089 [Cyanobacteriota bacterium]|jgi:hypothetical protein
MRVTALFAASLLAIVTTACVQETALRPEMNLQVAASSNDRYTVQGNTNLPGNTKILVQAVRSLQSNGNAASADASSIAYAIVAREEVITDATGKWQTTLQILQPQSQGPDRESWQQHNIDQQLALQPSATLKFMATTAALPRDIVLEGDVARQTPNLPSKVIQTNTDGTRFLKAEQSIDIASPSVNNLASAPLDRKVVPVAVQSIAPTEAKSPPEAKKTDAPLPIEAFVR